MDESLKIFIRNRIPGILFCVSDDEKVTISSLAKKTNITYSHMIELIGKFSLEGLISTEKIGRERIITLTTRGKKVKNLFKEIYELVTPG